jgi:hypothetical protein
MLVKSSQPSQMMVYWCLMYVCWLSYHVFWLYDMYIYILCVQCIHIYIYIHTYLVYIIICPSANNIYIIIYIYNYIYTLLLCVYIAYRYTVDLLYTIQSIQYIYICSRYIISHPWRSQVRQGGLRQGPGACGPGLGSALLAGQRQPGAGGPGVTDSWFYGR